MIKAILFDVDGVLVDSVDSNTFFYQSILVAHGYRRPTKKAVYKTFSMTLTDSVRFLTNEKSEKRIMEICNDAPKFRDTDNFKRMQELLKSYKDEEEVIEELHRKHKLGIVTSRRRGGVDFIFRKIDIERYFETLVAFEDYLHPKPSPEPLIIAAKRLKVRPEECIYIGDTDVDVMAARAAKMHIIGYSKKKLKGADITVKSFRELASAVSAIDSEVV